MNIDVYLYDLYEIFGMSDEILGRMWNIKGALEKFENQVSKVYEATNFDAWELEALEYKDVTFEENESHELIIKKFQKDFEKMRSFMENLEQTIQHADLLIEENVINELQENYRVVEDMADEFKREEKKSRGR